MIMVNIVCSTYKKKKQTESVNRLKIDRYRAAAVITNALCMHTRAATLGQTRPSLSHPVAIAHIAYRV